MIRSLFFTILFSIITFFLPVNGFSNDLESISYKIDARFDDRKKEISGNVIISFRNSFTKEIREISLFLYPNIYRDRKFQSRQYNNRSYPNGFHKGWMDITFVEDKDGKRLTYTTIKSDIDILKGEKDILVKVIPDIPIDRGKKVELKIGFITHIPEKLGVFGYFNGLTTLQGGWHPYLARQICGEWQFELPPQDADFLVNLSLDKDLIAAASGEIEEEITGDDNKRIIIREREMPFLSLSISRYFSKNIIRQDNLKISYFYLQKEERYTKAISDVVKEALSFFQDRYGRQDIKTMIITESYLHNDLSYNSYRSIFLSNRFFKVIPLLKRYHEARLVKSIFFYLWKEILPYEEDWVLEGLAGIDAASYIKIKFHNEFSLEGLLRPISFIPIFDQILYSKALPLRNIYFKGPAPLSFRTDMQLFNNIRPDGSYILFKLKNFLGKEIFESIYQNYIRMVKDGKRPLFKELSQELSKKDLEWFYTQWLKRNPNIDFGIEFIWEEKIDGIYHTTIAIRKEGKGIEPLKIYLKEKNGKELLYLWDGKSPYHEEIFKTSSPISVVELDPDRETGDLNRINNREPHRLKVLLERITGRYDLQSKMLEYNIGLSFQRLYDNDNILRLDLSRTEDIYGMGGAYTHLFRHKMFRGYQQSITGGISFEKPNAAIAQDNGEDKFIGRFRLIHTMGKSGFPIYSDVIQRITGGEFPYSTISTEYHQRITGGRYPYALKINLDIRKYISFSKYHRIALKALLGRSAGSYNGAKRYFLGGAGGMRGYRQLTFIGENIDIISAEYRFPLITNLEFNLSGLALAHIIQGAIFADTGTVSNERDIFRFKDYKSDIGVGIRIYFDSFGIYPTIGRIDAAIPINTQIKEEEKPHFYISVGQPF
ncbi:MAG: BamA/TamA family outer membrane protein [Nitrospirota bacterium]